MCTNQVWDELVWRSAHAQAPVAVVAKPHYFSHLDVRGTVRNMAARCPGFWASAEFRDCLAGGHILALDPDFFAQVLGPFGVDCNLLFWHHAGRINRQVGVVAPKELYSVVEREQRGSGALRRALQRFLGGASWRLVAAPLLPLLPGARLLRALTHALPDAPPGMHACFAACISC
jgi:hypothetical protein